jgi:hypothetical protein
MCGVHWPCETLHKTNVHRPNILTGVRKEKSLKFEQVLSFSEENAVDLYVVGDGLLGTNNGGTAFPIPDHCKVNCKLRSQ